MNASEENVKIVITDHKVPEVRQEQRAVDQSGGTLIVAQPTDEKQLARACRDADGVLNVRALITRPVITAMERCRIIVRLNKWIHGAPWRNRGLGLGNETILLDERIDLV